MSEKSKIEWTDDTHNFWRGCVKVSPGCKNCYAEVSTPVRVARSEGRELWGGTLRDRAKDFDAPLRWNEKPWVCDGCGKAHGSGALAAYGEKQICDGCGWREATFHRRRVFSLSLGDWLDDAVPIEWLADMLDVIRRCPNLDFLLLTKRPENWKPRMEAVVYWCLDKLSDINTDVRIRAQDIHRFVEDWIDGTQIIPPGIPQNVWIGCTVENQEWADKRIPELLKIPAVCRFISYEPALGAMDFTNVNFHNGELGHAVYNALDGSPVAGIIGPKIDWIIVGGESGPRARPFNVEWARSTVAQCKAAGVACFVKQMGAYPEDRNDAGFEGDKPGAWPMGTDFFENAQDPSIYQGKPVRVHLKDKKGGDITEWPEDLRVREFPTVK